MRLEAYNSEKLKKKVCEITKKYLDLSRYAVYFFGLRVVGKGDDRSDIDIGIDGDEHVPLDALRKIKEDIDLLPLLYKIDVVDISQTSDSFRRVAKKHIEYISKPTMQDV